MSLNERVVHASPGDVFKILGDGWTYAGWVVGAARIRDVDRGWPEPGRSIHHSVGSWPVLIDDTTTVEALEPDSRLKLKVRAWPTGEGRVEFTVAAHPEGCLVKMREDTVAGPAKLIPKPLLEPVLSWRNTETLRRLALLAEGHNDAGSASPGS
ncbi:SRPBCC family protein [Kribbella sp. NBC_01245]|uniref:SRPBCC family protein n=1 Tax=Kribbella sp. NBC_01245 TaxID=2903578 RepID=UPI002E2987DD|nr:SRPBCC family protein [Kribbella sp. NBC_01245]